MSPRPFERGSAVAGRYRIVAPIGRGASARVYLADDLQLGRRVAVKVLHEALAEDQKFLKRFEAEVRAAAALNHPNIMHVYDSGNDQAADGSPIPFLVMEFVGGGSLRAVLDSGPRLSPSQALEVGLETAHGLQYAHQNGFVHRDIKPANLLFGEERRLRIGDFGLARALAEATWTEPEGVLLGTAKYSSPEQALGKSVDGRSDVYSLALLLVEAVTGEVPFARDTTQATLMARTEADLEVPRSLGRLASVLERAGRRDPDLRPDAGELVIAFVAAVGDRVMDKPKPISLPGAIPVHALEEMVAEAGATTEVESDSGEADDITLMAIPEQTDIGALPVTRTMPAVGAPTATMTPPLVAAAAGATTRNRIDIPLDDTDPQPIKPDENGGSPAADGGDGDDQRRRWPWITATVLIVMGLLGGSAYWWFEIRIPAHTVVSVGGLSNDTATHRLEALGFRVTHAFIRKDGTKADEVVAQVPKAGTGLEEGKTVHLTVSLGNTLVTVPALTAGMDEATVGATLKAAGLEVGKRTEELNEDVAKGALVKFSFPVEPDSASQLPKGSRVDIVMSSGPPLRTIPAGLAGKKIDEVQSILGDLKLGVNVVQEFSDQPIDTVLRLSQPDGAQVPRDTVIDVTTSKGPELFPIPNVLGKSGIDASRILEAAGFVVAGITGSPLRPVVGVAPTVGEMHPKSTPVQLLTNS